MVTNKIKKVKTNFSSGNLLIKRQKNKNVQLYISLEHKPYRGQFEGENNTGNDKIERLHTEKIKKIFNMSDKLTNKFAFMGPETHFERSRT